MVPATCSSTTPVPPPSYHRALGQPPTALHLTARTLVTRLPLRALCRLAVQAAHQRGPPPLPKGPGGARRLYREESLRLLALLRTLWRLSYAAMRAWRRDWPTLAVACGRPTGRAARPRVPRPGQQWKPATAAGAPPCARRFVLAVREALRVRPIGAPDRLIASAPSLARWGRDPDAASGQAPAHHPTASPRGYRAHTLLCRGAGLPRFLMVAPANGPDAPVAKPLLAWAVRRYRVRPRALRRDAAYRGLALRHGIPTTRGAAAAVPRNPKRQKNRDRLPPAWTRGAVGKRRGLERFCGHVFRALQRPPVCGRTAVVQRVALTYTATSIVALAAHRAARPEPIRSPTRVLAHLWEESLCIRKRPRL